MVRLPALSSGRTGPRGPVPRPAAAVMALVLALCALTPTARAQEGEQPPPPAVTVLEIAPQDVTLTARLPGRIVASAVAEVRPQVSGIITERLFTEGGHVEAGDPLYRIDAATYEAAVAQAEAGVAQARAQSEAADKEEARVQELLDRQVSTQQALDTATAARDVARAAIAVADAQLTAARIELDRTTITAPLTGEIGLALTTQGALVTASQASPLAAIRTIDPVFVDVTQSASEVLRWRRQNEETSLSEAERTVSLVLADGTVYDHTGQLTAAEPQVDPQTGVVVLRMSFPNPEQLLLPGMYVRVDLQTDRLSDVFVVPQQAVGRDRRGRPTALVVGEGDVVEERQITVVQAQDNDWIVSEGLAAGERLVLEGSQKAAPGSTVRPEPAPAPEAGPEAEGDAAPAGAAADTAEAPAAEASAGAAPADAETAPTQSN